MSNTSTERIILFDTTLRDGEQSPGATMNLQEKIRLARQLETLGVDVIEAGFAASSPGDLESIQLIAKELVKPEIASLARATPGDIEKAWLAVRDAKHPRIHTFLATSALHMEYKLRKKPDEVLRLIETAVSQAASCCRSVEFSAEDASRSDPDFLVQAFNVAVSAGADTLNIPDTVGYAQPEEFAALVRHVVAHTTKATPDGRPVIFSVHCHNDLGLGVANSLAAVKAGARQVEGTVGGIGERAGNAALEEIIMALHVREDYYNALPGAVTEQIFPTNRMLSRIIGQPIPLNKPIVGDNAFLHESGIHQDGVMKKRETYEIMSAESIGRQNDNIVLGKHSGRNAISAKLEGLGYKLDAPSLDTVFAAVKRLADRKATIFDEDLEALVLEEVYRLPDKYRLVHLSVLSSDTGVPPTAMLVMEADGEEKKYSAFGAGPVDAVFKAIAHLVGRDPKLEQYSVNAITGGTDALGEVTVRISENGRNAVGRGSDPDIINASARAYLNALNRLVKSRASSSGENV